MTPLFSPDDSFIDEASPQPRKSKAEGPNTNFYDTDFSTVEEEARCIIVGLASGDLNKYTIACENSGKAEAIFNEIKRQIASIIPRIFLNCEDWEDSKSKPAIELIKEMRDGKFPEGYKKVTYIKSNTENGRYLGPYGFKSKGMKELPGVVKREEIGHED